MHRGSTLSLVEGIATHVVKLCIEATQCFVKEKSKVLPNYKTSICSWQNLTLLTYVQLAEDWLGYWG